MSLVERIQGILDEGETKDLLSFLPLIKEKDLIYNNACFYNHAHIARIWVKNTRLNLVLSAGGYVSMTYYPNGGVHPAHSIRSAQDFRSFFPEGDEQYSQAQQEDNIAFRDKQSFGLSITNEETIRQGVEYPSLQYLEYDLLDESVYAAKTLLERDWLPWIQVFYPHASTRDLLNAAASAPKNIVKVALHHPNASEEVHVAASLRR